MKTPKKYRQVLQFAVGIISIVTLFTIISHFRGEAPHNAVPFSAKTGSITNGVALRILPLGDSITFGFNAPPGNSYRRFLECYLHTSGHPVQYVGHKTHGDWADNANAGFTGFEIDEISTIAEPDLNSNARANIVLLHAGTNDLRSNKDPEGTALRLGNLIDKILFKNPTVCILVAQIIPNKKSKVNKLIHSFNKKIPEVVMARASTGYRVKMVSMSTLQFPEDFVDLTHPSVVGYRKMAKIWLQGIKEFESAGQIVPAVDGFKDNGLSAVPISGNCGDLTA